MAQNQTVVLVDDLDGGAAEQTVVFAVDGQEYEIDLSEQNIQRLHDLLAPYVAKARQIGPGSGASRQARRNRGGVPVTPPTATSTPPAEVTAPQSRVRSAHRPPVPVASFSNPDVHLPPPASTASKPHTGPLFSTTG